MNEETPTPRNKALENILAGTYIDTKSDSDNLAIALCCYFERHLDRPENDPPDDENPSWGMWVLEKQYAALRLLAADLLAHRDKWDNDLTTAEQAERRCAEMRDALKDALPALQMLENQFASSLSCDSRSHDADRPWRRKVNLLIKLAEDSPDAGQNYVRREEVEKAMYDKEQAINREAEAMAACDRVSARIAELEREVERLRRFVKDVAKHDLGSDECSVHCLEEIVEEAGKVLTPQKGGGSMCCRLCGKTAHEIGGYLHRVNELGEIGIWECRPCCDAQMSGDERVLAAIEDPATSRDFRG